MGDILSSIFGGGEQTNQTTTPDVNASALNKLKLGQLSGLFSLGNFGEFQGYNPNNAFKPSDQTSNLINSSLASYGSDPGAADLSDLLSLDDYINLGLSQAENYITQIAKPEILQSAALQGLEGGGYVPEALAKATAGVGLPFVQGLPAASSALTLARPQANLINQQARATGIQGSTSLLPFSDFGRSLEESDINRRQGILTTGLTGIPFSPGSKVTGGTQALPLFNLFGFGGKV